RSSPPQRVEAQTLHIDANNQGYRAKGDVSLGGTRANVDFGKTRGDDDAVVNIRGTFDDAARARMGIDLYGGVTGPVTAHFAGHLASSPDREGRLNIEADLTQAKVDNLLPGWVKPAGKAARATFTMTTRGKASRIDDFVLEGAPVKGSVE